MTSTQQANQASRTSLQGLWWRIHFWAGILTAPIMLMAAITGVLYIFSPQIEQWQYAHLDVARSSHLMVPSPHDVARTNNAPALEAQPLDAQFQAAQASLPNWELRSIIPAHTAHQTTQFVWMQPQHQAQNAVQDKRQNVAQNMMQNAGQNVASSQTMSSSSMMMQHDEHAEHMGHGEHSGTKSAALSSSSSLPMSSASVVVAASATTSITASTTTSPKKNNGDMHAPSSARITYVDPFTAEVQGSLMQKERFKEWSRKLHSSFLQGEGWRWIVELGACWLLVLMLSGLSMWWPKGKAGLRGAFRYPQSRNSRVNWRYWHSILGVTLCLPTLIIILTGITWSKYGGANFREMQNYVGQQAPRPTTTLLSTLPAAISASATPLDQALSQQTIWDIAKTYAPDIRLQMTPPRHPTDTWRVENYDRSQPEKRFLLILDAYSGKVLFQSGWAQYPSLARATAVGIPFHRGEFGLWNQILLLVVGISVIFSVVSGYVMWFKRRQPRQLSAPPLRQAHLRALSWWWLPLIALLAYALPVFGISLVVFLMVELLVMFGIKHSKPNPII